jgi:hypothetical protein
LWLFQSVNNRQLAIILFITTFNVYKNIDVQWRLCYRKFKLYKNKQAQNHLNNQTLLTAFWRELGNDNFYNGIWLVPTRHTFLIAGVADAPPKA